MCVYDFQDPDDRHVSLQENNMAEENQKLTDEITAVRDQLAVSMLCQAQNTSLSSQL